MFRFARHDKCSRHGQEDATLLCALRLNLDVDWNRLADARDCLGGWSKHQVEVAPRDWIDRYSPAGPAGVIDRCK